MPLFLVGQSHEVVALSGGGSGGRPIFELLHIEVFLLLPDLVFLRQQGADQAECRSVVGKDADHPFAPSDLLVQPLLHIRGAQSLAVFLRQRHDRHRILKPSLQASHGFGRTLAETFDKLRQAPSGLFHIGRL